jgi:nitrate reductase gamma subunit
MLRGKSHLFLHLSGALVAVAVACAIPAFSVFPLGAHWPLLVIAMVAVAPVTLLVAFVWKVARWMRAPLPFRIPLTVGQQQGLASISHSKTGSPRSTLEVLLRVVLDVLLLRPLFRTTPTAPSMGNPLAHGSWRWLWLIAVAFHGSLLVIVLRHLRLFWEPVPGFVTFLEQFDVATEMFLPKVHATSLVFPLALALLLGRRLLLMRVRYISLAADYFPLLLLLAIATTGLVMRHFVRTDVAAVKQLTIGLANGTLVLPSRADTWLMTHIFLVGLLLAYFPLSKLMHMPGALLSPTLTMANINREKRHINVRNPKVQFMHYADYEATFRDRMIEAGLPVEAAPEASKDK